MKGTNNKGTCLIFNLVSQEKMFYLSNSLYSRVTTLISERTDNQLFSPAPNLVFGAQGEKFCFGSTKDPYCMIFFNQGTAQSLPLVGKHKVFSSCF